MEFSYEYMDEFKEQLKKGHIQKAYKGLIEYILGLKSYLKNKYPDYFVSGSLYFGYMDMTYFSFTPKSLKQRKLKIAIVFNYDAFRFEVWLGGYNKQVQNKYWKLFKNSGWNSYGLVSSTKGVDAIIEHVLVRNPDFNDLDRLTMKIEKKTLEFINDIEEKFAEILIKEHDRYVVGE
jgi:hypothetical protein